MKFSNIHKETNENIELALKSLWTPGNHHMRQRLTMLLQEEQLSAMPVFQSMFPWRETNDPNWQNYLHPNVIQLLGGFTPYLHQTESWRELQNGNSIVVTSGTGSGKTECFIHPILSELCQNILPNGDDPVQAIFLYPLNALMEDQKARLGGLCQQLGLKFVVYNGSLDENQANVAVNPAYPNAEVMTRKAMRESLQNTTSCPQIMLTNPSMLEFSLVRPSDKPIYDRSAGRLKYIVIDEAHTYSGSAAIELAFLLKRVLSAYGVSRDDVQFICTSATIGDPAKPQELIDFIETIIGRSNRQRLVPIGGERVVPPFSLTDIDNALNANGITQTTGLNVQNLRDEINRKPLTLDAIWSILSTLPFRSEMALELLDRLCEVQINAQPLLMLRGHFFMKAIDGLYACINPACPSADGTSRLNNITTEKGNHFCPDCGAPLFELVQCKGCKEVLIACKENAQHEIRPLYISNKEDFETDDSDIFDQEYRNINYDDFADTNVEIDNTVVEITDPDNEKAANVANQIIANNDDWEEMYLRANINPYIKPHPNYTESFVNISYDAATSSFIAISQAHNGEWVMLRNGRKHHCPTCGKGKGEISSNFYPFTLSSSWLNEVIAPALLKEGSLTGLDWGKYIAFTDSRQGTAINAKKFNINSEKSFTRASLINALSNPANNPQVAHLIAGGLNIAQINTIFPGLATQLPEFTITDVADTICNTTIFDHINHENPTHNNAGDLNAYKTSLIRSHIGKRTMQFTGLESLGIITLVYPIINGQNNLPNEWQNAGFTIDEWKAFLKICVDYVIRLNNHLQPINGNEYAYLRETDRPTSIKFQDWPIVRRENNGNIQLHQSRLVLLLCAALGIYNPTDLDTNENIINTLLRRAWEFIKDRILTPSYPNDANNDQYHLDFSLTSQVCKVKLARSGWQCPVTKIFLDTIFRGYSPAIKGVLYRGNIDRYIVNTNLTVNMPVINSANFNQEMQVLLNIGFWNDRHKYAYAGTSQAYLTAEHSGQQNRELLRYYTDEFRAHRLNLLQCSTTMEIGVDIGDIDTVLMTNIPPTTANYLQRAGRAGRRGQSKALSFALCPHNSLGLQAFSNPLRLITGHTAAGRTVESNIIIQRHINSFFVKEFMYDTGATFNKVEDWFNRTNGANSVHEDFINWMVSVRNNTVIKTKFDAIFQPSNYALCADRTRNEIDRIGLEYNSITNGINQEYINAINSGNQEKATALRIQLYKFTDQIVKIYFAEKQFLPNADMPTGIVEFNYIGAGDVHRIAQLLDEIDNLRQQLSAPGLNAINMAKIKAEIRRRKKEIEHIKEKKVTSREIKIALREYAPEQTIVVNERNYRSAGIEWENSFGQGNPWKYLYWCKICGRYEYSENPALTDCPCGAPYRNVLAPNGTTAHCLVFEPIRFRTDINQGDNIAEETKRSYHQIDTILTNVDWANFQQGPMCEIIGNANAGGEIIFTNMGEGKGFNLCLDCGKMEVHRVNRDPQNWPHNDIRVYGQACANNNPRNKVMIVGKFPTSFVALRFYEDQTCLNYVKDPELLNSLGVILTRALASEIGINPGEIDFEVRKENNYLSIYIYDTAKGGCDYSTQLLDPNIMRQTFDRAKQLVVSYSCNCENHISKACPKCLVDRNSQRYEGKLSKQKLLVWLAKQNKANYTPIPGAAPAYMPIKLLLTNLYCSRATQNISFCVDASTMNLQEWTSKNGIMGNIINECLLRGKAVQLLIGNMPDFATCDAHEMIPFIDMQAKFPNCIVRGVDSVNVNGLTSLLIVDGKHFFTTSAGINSFNEDWGENYSDLYENSQIPSYTDVVFPTMNDFHQRLLPDEITKNCTIEKTYFDTMGVTRINEVFTNVIAPNLLDDKDEAEIERILHGKHVKITFSDAYVNSALSGLMLATIIKEFKNIYGFEIDSVDLMIQAPQDPTKPYPITRIKQGWNPQKPVPYVSFNHNDDQSADQFIRDVFNRELNIIPNLDVVGDHCRWLTFQPVGEDCKVEFRPDHGISGGWFCTKTYDVLYSLSGYSILKMHKDVDRIVFYLIYKRR